ncbi:unnamed protein product [Cunninghamella blakesleeana]
MSIQPPPHLKSRSQIKLWEKQHRENAAKRQKKGSFIKQDPFRFAERNFKLIPIPDNILSQVIDTNQLLFKFTCASIFGKPDDIWQQRFSNAYIIKQIPGLIIIPNPFTPKAQRELIELCLIDYAKLPNKSNLDAHYKRSKKTSLWESYEKEQKGKLTKGDDDYYLHPLQKVASDQEQQIYKEEKEDDNDKNQPSPTSPTKKLPSLSPTEALIKQRWITLGYQYDWKTKVYDLENLLQIPQELDKLAKSVVSAVEGIKYVDPFHSSSELSWHNSYKGADFKSEAGVINYYQLKDTLMAHVDKSEINMDAPLVSVSFGHACIYLIGGSTKDIPPIPLCLRSGDIVVMTGQSRNSYHGVPRILENSLPNYLSNENEDWPLFGNYMNHSRINLNIRQVFNPSN